MQKNGIMFLVKNGSVMDITETRNDFNNESAGYIANTDTFSDGTLTEYGDNITIVYTEGYYKDPMWGTLGDITKQSTVNVKRSLDMYSTNGIAYFSNKGGIINVGDTTTPRYINFHNYNGIAAYIDATDSVIAGLQKGKINIYGDITVEGQTPVTNIYENKGLVAISNKAGVEGHGGEINLTGNLSVKGIGAYVNGLNSKITLNGTNNVIVGKDLSAFAVLNGSNVTLDASSITNVTNDEDTSVLYADGTSQIDFQNSELNITASKGTILYGNITGLSLAKSTIILTDNGVTIGIKSNYVLPVSLTTGVSSLFPVTVVDGGFDYTFGLDGGIVNIDSDLVFGSNSTIEKNYNSLMGERIFFNINSNVTSTNGKGLAITSNNKAGSFIGGTGLLETGFNLASGKEINITGGTSAVSAYGLYINFGKTLTQAGSKLIIDKGVGIYGVNGSDIENISEITLLQDESIGILGNTHELATDGTPINRQTNVDSTKNFGEETITIVNNGKITIKDNSIAIKATNTNQTQLVTDMKITNMQAGLTDIIKIGDNSIGVLLDGVGEVDYQGELVTGDDSIGILAKDYDSKVTIRNSKFNLGNKSIGVDVVGSQETLTGTMLSFVSNVGKNTTDYGIGIIFEGKKGTVSGDVFTNNGIINVGSITDASNLIGIYAKELTGGAGESPYVENKGTINIYDNKLGIYAEEANVINRNTSTIAVLGENAIGVYGKSGSQITNEAGASLTLSGKNAIAIYAEGTDSKITNNGNLTIVSGDGAIGIYGKNNTLVTNTSGITLQNTILNPLKDNAKVGIFLEDTMENNINTGELTVGIDNIGIYAKNSKIAHVGTKKIFLNSDRSIGIYGEAAGVGNYDIELNADIDVSGDNSIGIYGTSGTGIGSKIDISGNIRVTAPATKKAVGVYVKGDNVTIGGTQTTQTIDLTSKGSIGIYVDGESKVNGTYNINLVDGSVGTYFTNKAYMSGGSVNIAGVGTTNT